MKRRGPDFPLEFNNPDPPPQFRLRNKHSSLRKLPTPPTSHKKLIDIPDFQAAWKDHKPAADGKQRMTDVADTEQLLRLIQSVPSLKFSTALPHAFTEHGALMAANVLNSPEPKRIIGFKAIQDSTE